MAISFTEYNTPAKFIKAGDDVVAVAAGQSLRIETSPSGEEVLDVVCPPGKSWLARIILEITETDA